MVDGRYFVALGAVDGFSIAVRVDRVHNIKDDF
jgi:hypothetical protein